LYYYNIHNIVKIDSEVRLYELEYFACSEFSDAASDMSVKVVDSITSQIHFKRKIIADEYVGLIKYTEHLGVFGAQFKLNFHSNKIKVTVNRLISVSKHVLYVNLVEPILRFLLISKGYVLLHSACMADGIGQGMLLSAPPDTGKTTTVLKCLKIGFFFLSDDMTILRLPNEAMCFPKPMTISAHTFKTATSINNNDNDNGSKRGGLKLRSLVHSKNGRQFMRNLGNYNVPIFTINTIGQAIIKPPKFKVEDLLQRVKIKETVKVSELFFLEKGGEETLNVPPNIALKKAVENSDDAFLFPPYKEMLQFINIGGRSARDLLVEETDMLDKFLGGINNHILKSDSKSWYETVSAISENITAV